MTQMHIETDYFAEARTPEEQKARLIERTAEAVASLDVARNRVLVATYYVSKVTAGGIIMPNKTVDENRFQGKVGLVLKMGPFAFKYDETEAHHGIIVPEIGDWVFYRPSDSWESALRGVSCRFIWDDSIAGILTDPTIIW
jgi:co-chaperonin GroES (HSP10)